MVQAYFSYLAVAILLAGFSADTTRMSVNILEPILKSFRRHKQSKRLSKSLSFATSSRKKAEATSADNLAFIGFMPGFDGALQTLDANLNTLRAELGVSQHQRARCEDVWGLMEKANWYRDVDNEIRTYAKTVFDEAVKASTEINGGVDKVTLAQIVSIVRQMAKLPAWYLNDDFSVPPEARTLWMFFVLLAADISELHVTLRPLVGKVAHGETGVHVWVDDDTDAYLLQFETLIGSLVHLTHPDNRLELRWSLNLVGVLEGPPVDERGGDGVKVLTVGEDGSSTSAGLSSASFSSSSLSDYEIR